MSKAVSEGNMGERANLYVIASARAWPLAAFLFVALAMGLPILNHLYLPLVDLPNHIARIHIAAAPVDGMLSTFYNYTLSLVPNSAADLVWHALNFPGDAARFAQILLATYAVNFIAAAMVLSRVAHGRWITWSTVAALLVYSAPFFWGFQNFVISLPFCLYGLALWLAMEEDKRRSYRVAVFLPLAVLLYLMHFFAFMILAIAIFGREVDCRLKDNGPLARRAMSLSINMLPFALPVLWLAISLITDANAAEASRNDFGSLSTRYWGLVSPLVAPDDLGLVKINPLSFLALGLLSVCLLTIFRRSGPRLVLSSRMRGPVVALAIAAVLAPSWLNGVAHVQIRIPVLLVAVLIAGTSWQGLRTNAGVFIAIIFGVLISARGVVFNQMAQVYGTEMADLVSATSSLPSGARVLPLRAAGKQRDRRYYHLQGHLVAMHDAFVPTLFQGTHALKVRDEWVNHAEPVYAAIDLRWLDARFGTDSSLRPVFVENWEDKFTHAILLDHVDPTAWDDPRLVSMASSGRFTLYRVVPTPERSTLD